jgi:hypothetical protein
MDAELVSDVSRCCDMSFSDGDAKFEDAALAGIQPFDAAELCVLVRDMIGGLQVGSDQQHDSHAAHFHVEGCGPSTLCREDCAVKRS